MGADQPRFITEVDRGYKGPRSSKRIGLVALLVASGETVDPEAQVNSHAIVLSLPQLSNARPRLQNAGLLQIPDKAQAL